jgi:apolipoprotein N-acyltransferase
MTIVFAPIFILRFIRTQPAGRGIGLMLLGFLVIMNISLWGIFTDAGGLSVLLFNVIRSSLLALLYFLPFMFDRLIYPKFKDKGPLSTVIFPIMTTAVFFFLTIEGPFEGSYQMGKFLYGPIILNQLISVLGLTGSVFLTSWLASVVNDVWEHEFQWKTSKKLVITYAALVLAVLAFGAIKTSSLGMPEADTVKVAAIIFPPEDGNAVGMGAFFDQKLTSPFEKRLADIEHATSIAASNGAKIVSFQEFAMALNEEDRETFITTCQEIAKEYDVYVSMTYAYFATEGKGKNIHMLIDNTGQMLLEYQKKYLAGMGDIGETKVFSKGPEIIQSVETPYGRLSVSVCREIDMA